MHVPLRITEDEQHLMKLVNSRSAATLLPLIQAHVSSGTVHSDEWSVYRRASLPNVSAYDTVNHSIEFVNPTNGVHTQNVELLEQD